MFHVALSKESSTVYRPMQLQKAYQLIQNLLSTPQDYPAHCYTYAAPRFTREISDRRLDGRQRLLWQLRMATTSLLEMTGL